MGAGGGGGGGGGARGLKLSRFSTMNLNYMYVHPPFKRNKPLIYKTRAL